MTGAALALCAASALLGCGGGSGGGSGSTVNTYAPAAASLLGHWLQTGVGGSAPFAGSQTSPCPGYIYSVVKCGSSDSLQFNSGGTFIHQAVDPASNTESPLTLTVTASGDGANGNGVLDASEVLPNSAHVISGNVTLQNGVLDFTFDQPYPTSDNVVLVGGAFTETDSYKKQ